MGKKLLIFNCIILLMVCQLGGCGSVALALKETQIGAISDYCNTIRQILITIQHQDARTRTYLGTHYETILGKMMTPLNSRLVKNEVFAPTLLADQSLFAVTKADFADDFIEYQKMFDDLTNIDCKVKPQEFYQQLEVVREKRKIMAINTKQLRGIITGHLDHLNKLREEL